MDYETASVRKIGKRYMVEFNKVSGLFEKILHVGCDDFNYVIDALKKYGRGTILKFEEFENLSEEEEERIRMIYNNRNGTTDEKIKEIQ